MTGRRALRLLHATMNVRTRSGIRTRNIRALDAAPLPVGLPGLGGPTRDRTGHARLARRRCTPVLRPRASGRTRTDYLHGTKVAQVRTCFAGIGTLGRTRTGTGRPLRPLPPTVGLRGHARWERRIRTSTRLLQRQVSFLLDQLPIGRRGAGGRPAAGRTQRAARAAHDGARGVIRSGIRASAGVLSPLRWLHGPHAATVFFQVFRPPRERGTMWSTVVA